MKRWKVHSTLKNFRLSRWSRSKFQKVLVHTWNMNAVAWAFSKPLIRNKMTSLNHQSSKHNYKCKLIRLIKTKREKKHPFTSSVTETYSLISKGKALKTIARKASSVSLESRNNWISHRTTINKEIKSLSQFRLLTWFFSSNKTLGISMKLLLSLRTKWLVWISIQIVWPRCFRMPNLRLLFKLLQRTGNKDNIMNLTKI